MIKVLVQVSGGSADRRIYNERTLEYKETRHGHVHTPIGYGMVEMLRGKKRSSA